MCLSDFVSSFRQITVHKDAIPLTAFCTPAFLFGWLVKLQGSKAAPRWPLKIIKETVKGLDCVTAYLEDVILSDPDPSIHVLNVKVLFPCLRKHNITLSPRKATIGATDAGILSYAISPADIKPNAR